MKYIAVIHKWYASNEGFEVFNLDSETKEEAIRETKIITYDLSSERLHTAYKIIEIEDSKQLKTDRKLTIMERLTGKLKDN